MHPGAAPETRAGVGGAHGAWGRPCSGWPGLRWSMVIPWEDGIISMQRIKISFQDGNKD